MNNKLQVKVADCGPKKPQMKKNRSSQLMFHVRLTCRSSAPAVFNEPYSQHSRIYQTVGFTCDASAIHPVSNVSVG